MASTDDFTIPSCPSMGCDTTPTDPLNQPTQHMVAVPDADPAYQSREYFVRLPEGYDAERAYPLVLLGHGCGGDGRGIIPVHEASQGDAIVAGLSSVDECFATGDGGTPEILFFDAVLAQLEVDYCLDRGKVFVSGFSSGGWLSYLLSCARGDVIRGIGAAAGGFGDSHPECHGSVAAILAADTEDGANPIVNIDPVSGNDEGSGAARDRLLALNGCSDVSVPWDPQFPECNIYQGCKPGYEVVWCETTGKGHSDHVPLSSQGFWSFWSALE